MAINQSKTNDNDFFKLLADEQQAREGNAADQIVFRDADGKMKILKQGKVFDYNSKSGSAVMPLVPKPVPAELPPKSASVIPASPISRPRPPVMPAARLVPAAAPFAPAEIDSQIRNVISRSGIKFTNEDELRRFKNLIISGLRGIRDRIDLLEALSGEKTKGGMGLAADSARKVIDLIRNEREEPPVAIPKPLSAPEKPPVIEAKPAVMPPPPAATKPAWPPVRPVAPPPPVKQSMVPAPAPKPPAMEIRPAAVKPVVSPPKPTAEDKEFADLQREMKSILGTGPAAPKSPVQKPVVADVIKPKTHIPIAPIAKPKIEEVKYQSKLVGPIEEIRSMKLVDFRRLAPTSAAAAKKVLDKIELLERESFAQRHQAIKAWRENEISRLYLELGDQSMAENKPISDVIQERMLAKQPTLTEAELEAVIELKPAAPLLANLLTCQQLTS